MTKTARIIEIAAAVVFELNKIAWTTSVTATRAYAPRYDLSDLSELRVTVIPRGMTIDRATRGVNRCTYQIDIGVQRRCDGETGVDLDPLMELVEEFADHFNGLALSLEPEVVCVALENGPIYAQEHIREARVFTSVLTLSFVTWR